VVHDSLAKRAGAMEAQLVLTRQPVRLLILVPKIDHRLADLLYKFRIGEMPIEVVGIASNHPVRAHIQRHPGHPFHHLPVTVATSRLGRDGS
jgi:formyltetrahydrofolate deformylase